MLNNIFATTVLSVTLLISGLDSAAASDPVNADVLSQSVIIAANTAEQRVLNTKGFQYRPAPSDKTKSRSYRFNESKKAHKTVRSKKSYHSNKLSQPNPSRKLSYRGGLV